MRVSGAAASRAAGWRALHAALIGGVPHASEIVMLLDSGGFTFPSVPDFDDCGADLVCYGVIHRAWREGMLADFLRLLYIWRIGGSRLCEAARRPEFQEGLLEFLHQHRAAGFSALVECLAQRPAWQTAPAGDSQCEEAVRRRFEILWRDYCGRRAA